MHLQTFRKTLYDSTLILRADTSAAICKYLCMPSNQSLINEHLLSRCRVVVPHHQSYSAALSKAVLNNMPSRTAAEGESPIRYLMHAGIEFAP